MRLEVTPAQLRLINAALATYEAGDHIASSRRRGRARRARAIVWAALEATYPEGTATCDNCGRVEHTAAELAACIESVLGPVRDDD